MEPTPEEALEIVRAHIADLETELQEMRERLRRLEQQK